ncbi:MAG: hypothetical protein FWF87_04735 [Synergistaceae bacterium]|nr:hypothetical protein [Synergistaceae bacterium]
MKDVMCLKIYGKDGLIETMEVDLYTWYEEGVEIIDSAEARTVKGITKIKGAQYDELGKIESSWCTYYNSAGEITKSEEYDANSESVRTDEMMYDTGGKLLKWDKLK